MKNSRIVHYLAQGFALLCVLALLALPAGIESVHAAPASSAAPVVDQEFTTPTNASTPINGCCRYVGQTFTAGLTGDLAAVSLDVLSTGPFALHIAIHGVTNGLPNATILGERTLWTTDQNPIVSAPLSMVIEFFDPIYVRAGHQYAIVVDYDGSGGPGQSQGDWSGATGNAYVAGAAYETNDETMVAWDPAGAADMDLHFKTYVITGVPVSDLSIRVVSAPHTARACEVFKVIYRVRNLGPNRAENVVVGVGGTDQFDVIRVNGVAGSLSKPRRLAAGQSMLVTATYKVTAFVLGESRDGRIGATVSSDVYPNIAIDPNLNNNVKETRIWLVGKQRMSCGK